MKIGLMYTSFRILLLGVFTYISLQIFPLSLHVSKMDHRHLISHAQADQCSLDALSTIPSTARKAGCAGSCPQLTCKAILFPENDSSIYEKARKWMKAHPITIAADETFLDLTQDCHQFRLKGGYHTETPSKEESNFPIAYNIIMHKDVAQVERVLRAIYRPQNEYCIHVDAKQRASVLAAMKAIAGCFSNVHIASKLERVTYSGFSRLQADINCMHDLVNKVSTKWKYLINLAGQAFPLKTNLEMVQTLKVYNGSNDIEGIFGTRIHKGRFIYEFVEVNTNTSNPSLKATGNKNPKPPHDINIIRGSAYGIFSRGYVDFVLNDRRAQDLLEWSKKTWSPDEHYWATLHHLYTNSHLKTPGGYPGKPDDKPWLAVYAAWGGRDKCEGLWRNGVCVFGVADTSSLVNRKEFFANKFYMTFEPFALDCMEQWLEFKIKCPPKFDRNFYMALPFIQGNLWKLKKTTIKQ